MAARALVMLALVACAGPKPRVVRATVSPSPRPGSTRVEVELANHGGAGEIELDIHLRDRGSGAEIDTSDLLEVGRDQDLVYVTDIATPPGDWAADVDAQYPD